MTTQHNHYDVIILGAGAAGMMCAIEAGKRGRKILLLDKAAKAGRKVLISGGGRCNFTNLYTEPEAYLSENPHFCKSALSRYTPWDFIALMAEHNLTWNEKKLGQLFSDDKAIVIVKMLLDECSKVDSEIRLNCSIESVKQQSNQHFSVKTEQGVFTSESLAIATGGPSIPRMGSTDLSQSIARQFGMKSIPFRPALVPFTFSQEMLGGLFKDLPGISLDVNVSCGNQSFRENLLFTHRGLSGPSMLQISSYWKKNETLLINMLPDIDTEHYLLDALEHHPKTQLKTILAKQLPKRLAENLCTMVFGNKAMKEYSTAALSSIATQLNQWQLQPSGTEGMRTAEVCLGGLDTTELSSKTFACKKNPNLYFLGEAIDVTGHLGGYNLQWAWASGWCAGQCI